MDRIKKIEEVLEKQVNAIEVGHTNPSDLYVLAKNIVINVYLKHN
jgi:hypothetical protein